MGGLAEQNFQSVEELKRYFREKIKALHPDKGGNKEDFLEFISWYEELAKKLKETKKVKVVKRCPLTGDYIFSILEFSVEEIARGGRKKIKIPYAEETCELCKGTGKNLNGRSEKCGFCKGSGYVEVFDTRNECNTYLKCPYCKGLGYLLLEQCSRCFGKGKIKKEKEIFIEVPLGLKEGEIIHIPKEAVGATNDLYYEVVINPHPYFTLKGNNLIYRCEIPLWEILLNEYISIPTLEGEESIPTEKFMENGSIVLKGRGPFLKDGSRGDFIIDFKIIMPSKIPDRARKLIFKAMQIIKEEAEKNESC